jgi:hypothetical protein
LSDESYFAEGPAVALKESGSFDLEHLSTAIVRALQRARSRLLDSMADHGLTPEAGWRINEELRHTLEATEWILTPIHMREPAPPALEVRVRIDAEGRLVDDMAG